MQGNCFFHCHSLINNPGVTDRGYFNLILENIVPLLRGDIAVPPLITGGA